MNQDEHIENKPKLIPVKVPWQISLAVPAVRVTIYAGARIEIDFDAITWHEVIGKKQSNGDKTYDQYHEHIAVSFPDAFWFRSHPTVIEDEIDYEKYDTSALGPIYIPSKDISKYLDAYKRAWLNSGICPDPGMYEVEGSDWMPSEIALKDGYKHYLLVGQELYYEIYSKYWEWSSKGITNGPS